MKCTVRPIRNPIMLILNLMLMLALAGALAPAMNAIREISFVSSSTCATIRSATFPRPFHVGAVGWRRKFAGILASLIHNRLMRMMMMPLILVAMTVVADGQFTFTTNNGTIAITGYGLYWADR